MKAVWKKLAYPFLLLGLLAILISVPAVAAEGGIGYPEPPEEVPELAEPVSEAVTASASAYPLQSGATLMTVPPTSTEAYAEVKQVLYAGLFARQETIDLSAWELPTTAVADIYTAVINENPDLFFVKYTFEHTSIPTSGFILSVKPDYDPNYGVECDAAFHKVCGDILSQVEEGWSDVQKLLFLHDYLVTHCEYDFTYSRYNAYDALVGRSAVCQGYTLAYIYLCKQEGITVEMVTSAALEHAWNLVTLGDEQFYVDCTWDDPTIDWYEGRCVHTYFLRSRDAFGHTGSSATAPVKDWLLGDLNAYESIPGSDRYDGAWFIDATTAIPMIGSVAAYALSDDRANVYLLDLAPTAVQEPVKVALAKTSTWPVWNMEGYIWPKNFCSLARLEDCFYYTTPTEVWRLSPEGALFQVYALTPEEQAVGYLYGIVNDGGTLYYNVGTVPCTTDEHGTATFIRPALDLAPSGVCGDGLAWEFADGELTVTGSGPMYDWPGEANVPWFALREKISSVRLSGGVTHVGNYAFCCCKALTAARYEGSDEDWDAVTVGDFNIPLLKALESSNGTPPDPRMEVSLTDTPTGYSHTVQSNGHYPNWAGVSSVSQFLDEQGRFCFAVDEGGQVTVYRTDQGSVVSSVSIPNPFNSFGGAVCGSDGSLYLVWGFNNDTDSDEPDTSVATIILGKYTAEGELVGYAGGNGSEGMPSYYPVRFYTKTPFHAGNCDVAISGSLLVVNYAREMYSGHQANTVLVVDTASMTVKTGITSYNSHSFDQRVTPYGKTGGFLLESQGDCYPRTFTTSVTDGSKTLNNMDTFDFWVESGAYDDYDMYKVNKTRARLGNILETSCGAALIGASVRSLSEAALTEPYDVFVQVFDPTGSASDPTSYVTEGVRSGLAGNNGDVEVTDYGVFFLTDLAKTDPGKTVDAVQAVSLDNDRILVLYELWDGNDFGSSYDSTWCILLSGTGAVLREAQSLGAVRLNLDEDPVFAQGAVWWVSNAGGSDELVLHRIEVLSSRTGLFGAERELAWELWKGSLTVTGSFGETAPVVAAFYGENGSMLGVRVLTESGLEVPVPEGAVRARLYHVNIRWSPSCPPAGIKLEE